MDNTIICEKCGELLDVVNGKTEFHVLSSEPFFAGYFSICPKCGARRAISIMDREQAETFKKLRELLKQIRSARSGGWRAGSIERLQKQADTLQAYMQARAPELLEMYAISQQVKEKTKARRELNNGEE